MLINQNVSKVLICFRSVYFYVHTFKYMGVDRRSKLAYYVARYMKDPKIIRIVLID